MAITKKEAQRIHAKKRFRQRYGLDFNRHVRRDFVAAIRKKEVKLVMKQSSRVYVFDILYKGKAYRFVYDMMRKEVITALNMDDDPTEFLGQGNYIGAAEKEFLSRV